jgi:sec-independent protein translocase protein TatA
MGWDAPWHWVVLAIIVIALFGYKKLPDAARSLGRSLRIFRTEIKGMNSDDAARSAANEQPAVEPPTPAPQPPVAPIAAPPPMAVAPPAAPAPASATEQQGRPDGPNSHVE